MSGAIREVDEIGESAASRVVPARPSDTEPAPPPVELGPVAGIVRIPGEELFEAMESEEDIVNANRELLEGRPLTTEETGHWVRLVNEIQREANKRLKPKGIVLITAVPEPNGLGAVFVGCDSVAFDAAERGVAMPSDEYVVTFTLPARERVDIQRAGNEDFVRWALDIICSECVEQQAKYRAQRDRLN